MSGPHQVEIHEIGPHEITASVLERPDRGGGVRRYQTYQFLAVLETEVKTIVIHHDVSHGDAKETFRSVLCAEQLERLVFKKLVSSHEYFDLLNDGTVIKSLSSISTTEFCSIGSRSTT
jgi:hypothetical protein